MLFRQANATDIAEVSLTSISRGIKESPEAIDFVVALEHDGKVLGVGGIKLMVPGTAWVWMDWSKSALSHTSTIYRVTKEWLEQSMRTYCITRAMAAVRPSFQRAIRTVEHLGFHRESTMKRFFGDEDGIMYVKFMEHTNG